MFKFNQSIQDPVSEDKNFCSPGGGRDVFPDLAGEVMGCIGGGPKSVSGEGGIKCIGMGIRSKEVPSQFIIPRTQRGSAAVECVHDLN